MKYTVIFALLVTTISFAVNAQTTRQLIDSSRFYKKINFSKAISFAGAAYKQANLKKQYSLKGESAYLLGVENYLQGNLEEALRWYFDAENVYINVKDTKGLIELYEDMSILYLKLKKFNEAEAIIKKAINYSVAIKDTSKLATAINNQGLIFLDKGIIDSAINSFQDSYILYKKIKDRNGMAYSLDYLSEARIEKRLYTLALQNLNESKLLRKGLGDIRAEAESIENIGELYLKEKKVSEAIPFFLDAIKKAHDLKYLDLEVYAYKMLTQTYQQQGKYVQAYQAQTKYIDLNQKLQNDNRTKAIEELQTRYETNKKQQQIRLLNKQNTIQQLEISKRNITITIIAIIFISSLVIGYQFYSRYKINQETRLQSEIINQQALASKGIINAEERERKRIAGELHDGVGQLFTTVKMNLEILIERFLVKKSDANLLAEKTMALVDESCTEVRSIAHQMMPNALVKSGLVSALRDFINKIPSNKLKITIETKGIEKGLENTTETVLYRVIQESVNNVIKHANATALDILLLCDEKEITVSIEDNGKGFNTDEKDHFAGIGLKNMISRIEYLKGTVDISSAPGKGTLVAIFIPLI